MELHVTTYHGRTMLSVVRLDGRLDATSYTELIDTAKRLFGDGVRQIVLDLGALTYISSAGLMAFQAMAVLLRGGTPPDPEDGWDALYRAADDMLESPHPHLKLLNPQAQVFKTLERVKFTTFLEIYTSLDAAIGACLPMADRPSKASDQLHYMQALNPDLSRKPGGKREG